MQNLALTSQFGNSGRRGSSSTNTFQSLVMNGVLPPSDDGRVEAIQLFDPKTKKYKQYNGRTTNSSGLGPSGVAFDEWGIQPDDMFGDPNSGSGGSVDGPAGRGGIQGGEDDDRENWDPHNTGGTIRINFPGLTPNHGYFYPSDKHLEEKARQTWLSRVLGNVQIHFGFGGFTNQVFNTVKNNLISSFNALNIDSNGPNFSYLTKFLQDLLNKMLIPDSNVMRELEEYIKEGKFSKDPVPKSFTIHTEDFESNGIIIETAAGFLESITIKVQVELIDGKTYLTFYSIITVRDRNDPQKYIKLTPQPLYRERID